MKKKLAIIILALSMVLSLAACGGGVDVTGTWYDQDDHAVMLNLEKDGRAVMYDADYDESMICSWSEEKEEIRLEMKEEGTGVTVYFKLEGEDKLVSPEATLVRGADKTLPLITYTTLYDYFWVSEDGKSELVFYDDYSWSLDVVETGEIKDEGNADSVAIEGNTITLTNFAGNKLKVSVSDDAVKLTLDKTVFVKSY